MNYDVVALGELLIDFTDSGKSPQGNPLFEANPGGAPGNVLAMLSKSGKKTAFIGKIGDDMFGRLLTDTLDKIGIDTRYVSISPSANTTLAFVKNAPDGDREFSFFRKPGADTLLCEQDIPENLMKDCRILHFGSLSLTNEPARSATQKAVELAQRAGAMVSFDPNLRPLLWGALEEAREQIVWGCGHCHILKISEDELSFITSISGIGQGANLLLSQNPQMKMLFVTKGKEGSEVFHNGMHAEAPAFLQVKAIDTTGAGDTFFGACLSYILQYGVESLTQPLLKEMLTFANGAAALVCSKKGAICSMPEYDEVLAMTKI